MKIKLAMTALLLTTATTAFAADAVIYSDAVPVATAQVPASFNWTGAYAGISAGYAWGDASVTNSARGVNPGPFDYDFDGGIGGAQIGYNWQMDSNVVLGVEADLGYMGSNGLGIIGSTGAGHHQRLTLDGGLYGDITGRVGYAFDRAMIYGKGGFAFFNGEAKQQTTKPDYAATGTGTFTGWTLGGGIAYKLAQNVSLDLGYQYFDFGSADGFQTSLVADGVTPAGEKFMNNTSLTANVVKIGINYHF